MLFGTSLQSVRFTGSDKNSWTVGEIMDLFISEVKGGPFEKTVDTLKAGNRDIIVSGIVTSMFATIQVIKQAIDKQANFIIAHEPTFYNHLDETDWLKNDDVYNYKAKLLAEKNMAVWRNHDYVHTFFPDGVQTGLVEKLGWEKYYHPESRNVYQIPETTVGELARYFKKQLGIPTLRFEGDLKQSCKKVLLMPGAAGGRRQIEMIAKEQPDVVLCGEVSEWETPEYIRDARSSGKKISLIILGHADSEEPGSAFMLKWLQQKVPGLKVFHISSSNPLSFI